jgi:hypothetical protein
LTLGRQIAALVVTEGEDEPRQSVDFVLAGEPDRRDQG